MLNFILLMMGGHGQPEHGGNPIFTLVFFFIAIPILVFPYVGFFVMLNKYKKLKRNIEDTKNNS